LRHSSSSQSKYPFLESTDGGLYLTVKVTPRASKEGLALSEAKDELKVRLTKAPVDGEANKALTALLAKSFKISKSSISITSGKKSRTKRVKITDIKIEDVKERLGEIVK
jgi:uncharacterized protein (TIGR00251 family)